MPSRCIAPQGALEGKEMTHALKRLASLFVVVVALSVFASVPAAFAAMTAQEAYAPQGGTTQADISGGGGSGGASAVGNGGDSTAAATAGTTKTQDGGNFLPFTGLDIGFLVMVGGGLLGLGFGLRRLTRLERQTS
jgi:hypothetical protein